MPKITFQIVTYNSERFLPGCLKSIFNQTRRDFQVFIIDNNSQDDTVKYIKNNFPEVTVFENKKNVGFSKANNQGIQLLHSPYIVFINPDIILEPDWLEKIMNKVGDEKYKDHGSFGGKLLKLRVLDYEIDEVEKTTTIDSLGLKQLNSFRFVELGAGEDEGKWQNTFDVFGHSCSLVLYRREVLDSTAIKTERGREYFDEDFFFYKEDVDLAWRINTLGWKSLAVVDAVAYHIRTMAGSEKTSKFDLIKNKRKQSKLARYYSYRNHFLLLLKNLSATDFRKSFFPILYFEFQKFIFVLLFEIKSIGGIFAAVRLIPKMRKKRKQIVKKNNSKL